MKEKSHIRRTPYKNPRSMKEFKERTGNLIKETGKSQRAFAESIGCDPRTFNHYLTNSTIPDVDIVVSTANKLKVSVDYLLGRDDDPELMHSSFLLIETINAETNKVLDKEIMIRPKGFNENMKLVAYHFSNGATFLCDLNNKVLSYGGSFLSIKSNDKTKSDHLDFSFFEKRPDQVEWKRSQYLPTGCLTPPDKTQTILEKDIQVLGRVEYIIQKVS